MKNIIFLISIAFLTSCNEVKKESKIEKESASIDDIANQYIQHLFKYNPELGTFYQIENSDNIGLSDNSHEGLEKVETLRLLSQLESVSGRFQYLVSDEKITAIVDYAHTPDALKNVLETINTIRTKNEELITVVGCGGDRDITKRPKMGNIASALSTKVIFTSDNPRSEVPEAIIEAIEKGVEPQNFKKTMSIADRKQAIKTACQLAKPNDIILIAGKGHETYQEIKGERFDFDDYKIVQEFLKQLQK